MKKDICLRCKLVSIIIDRSEGEILYMIKHLQILELVSRLGSKVIIIFQMIIIIIIIKDNSDFKIY